jgi:hypothetical protein
MSRQPANQADLDADMRPSDLANVLEKAQLRADRLGVIRMDAGVRDFFVRLLRQQVPRRANRGPNLDFGHS